MSCHRRASASRDRFILNPVREPRALFTREMQECSSGNFLDRGTKSTDSPWWVCQRQTVKRWERGRVASERRPRDWQGQAICGDSVWAPLNWHFKAEISQRAGRAGHIEESTFFLGEAWWGKESLTPKDLHEREEHHTRNCGERENIFKTHIISLVLRKHSLQVCAGGTHFQSTQRDYNQLIITIAF